MHCREVVTFQLGHYSSFIGAHWWNLQEGNFVYASEGAEKSQINHDVMFREGQTLSGDVTYCPRLISMDLKGSLSTLKQDGTLYDVSTENDDVAWSSDVTMHKESPVDKNEFLSGLEYDEDVLLHGDVQRPSTFEDAEKEGDVPAPAPVQHVPGRKYYDLDDKVNVWSDYMRTHLHPQSTQIIREFQHQDEHLPFDIFGKGQQVFGRKVQEELEDRIHFFFEECDSVQGIHVLADTGDSFGGIASSVCELLQDDYSTKPLFVVAAEPCIVPNSTAKSNLYRLLNTALSYERIYPYSSVLLPLSMKTKLARKPGPPVVLPYLNYKPELSYHTSAVLAASLDSCTLPYRMNSGGTMMSALTGALSPQQRKLLSLNVAMPFNLSHREPFANTLLQHQESAPWTPLSMQCSTTDPSTQSVVLSGVSEHQALCQRSPNVPTQLTQCRSIQALINLYISELYPRSANACFVVNQPCKVTAPFPHIFKDSIGAEGQLLDQGYVRDKYECVDKVSITSSLQCSPDAASLFKDMHAGIANLDIRKHHAYLDTGLELDDFVELKSNILSMADNYT